MPGQSHLPVRVSKRSVKRYTKNKTRKIASRASWRDRFMDIFFPRKHKPKKIVRRLQLKAVDPQDAEQQALKNLSCMCSVVALHALLAKLRGNISAHGFLEFRCLFPIGDMESRNLRYLFKLAWQDTQTVEHHVSHILALYPEHEHIYQRIVEGLARQMLASETPSRQEVEWLQQMASCFSLSRMSVRQILERASRPMEASPYWLFNVPKNASKQRIQQAYKKMMLACHPDKVHGAAYPETSAAAEKLSTAATLAYDAIKRDKQKRLKMSA